MLLPGVGLTQSIRRTARYILTFITLILIAGLVLSPILDTDTEQAIPEPGVVIEAEEADSHTGDTAEVFGEEASAS